MASNLASTKNANFKLNPLNISGMHSPRQFDLNFNPSLRGGYRSSSRLNLLTSKVDKSFDASKKSGP